MKIFIDSANFDEIKDLYWLVEGITTNPTLLAKENISPQDLIKKIKDDNKIRHLGEFPISLEVLSQTHGKMIEEALALYQLSPNNIVVKLPLTTEGLIAAQELQLIHDIRTNLTLCFTPQQAILAAKVNATYVSPFIGRLNDYDNTASWLLLGTIKTIYKNYNFKTKILAASIRSTTDFLNAACDGADAITTPYKVLKEIHKHELTDIGLEKFINDSKTLNK